MIQQIFIDCRIEEMRREAMWAVQLMQEMYNRIRNEESKQKGLIIIRAVYGKFPPGKNILNISKKHL